MFVSIYNGIGSLSLFQGIVPTHGSNPGLPHWKWILYQLSQRGNPRILKWVAYPFSRASCQPKNRTGVSCLAGRFFTNWAIREAHLYVDDCQFYHFNPELSLVIQIHIIHWLLSTTLRSSSSLPNMLLFREYFLSQWMTHHPPDFSKQMLSLTFSSQHAHIYKHSLSFSMNPQSI